MISFILPTRNRPQRLSRTLAALAALPADAGLGSGEVLVVDNASQPPVELPARLANGLAVRGLRLGANRGAAARNRAAAEAAGRWLVMLDDDSFPADARFLEALADAPPDVAAIGADIRLPDDRREDGGLPEVFVGCGAAVRREAFLAVGGYDPTFHYYAEEYDLCAKLLLAGHRVVHDQRFRVTHARSGAGRDINLILRRLVRNNGWVLARYAPDSTGGDDVPLLAETVARYGRIARREGARRGWLAGMRELVRTMDAQPRRPMSEALFDRFTGLAHARAGLAEVAEPGTRVAVVEEGKNAWAVHLALHELDLEVVEDPRRADVEVIGTLSPGPMLDAWHRRRRAGHPVIAPWFPEGAGCGAAR